MGSTSSTSSSGWIPRCAASRAELVRAGTRIEGPQAASARRVEDGVRAAGISPLRLERRPPRPPLRRREAGAARGPAGRGAARSVLRGRLDRDLLRVPGGAPRLRGGRNDRALAADRVRPCGKGAGQRRADGEPLDPANLSRWKARRGRGPRSGQQQSGHLDLRRRRPGGPARITFDPGEDYTPVFSRDGKKIAYTSYRKGVWSINEKTLGSSEEEADRNRPAGRRRRVRAGIGLHPPRLQVPHGLVAGRTVHRLQRIRYEDRGRHVAARGRDADREAPPLDAVERARHCVLPRWTLVRARFHRERDGPRSTSPRSPAREAGARSRRTAAGSRGGARTAGSSFTSTWEASSWRSPSG